MTKSTQKTAENTGAQPASNGQYLVNLSYGFSEEKCAGEVDEMCSRDEKATTEIATLRRPACPSSRQIVSGAALNESGCVGERFAMSSTNRGANGSLVAPGSRFFS